MSGALGSSRGCQGAGRKCRAQCIRGVGVSGDIGSPARV